MAELNLIKKDGKGTEKLLDVIGNFLGIVYKPRAIRKEADAKAYEIIKIAEANSQALEIEQKAELDRLDRAQERMYSREIMRQMNIESVALNAAEVLKIESNVSDEPVDKDWVAKFFNIVEDISNEQMQYLWGRLLAGEVKRPKSFSLRTLEVLRNLSIEEAGLFEKISRFLIVDRYMPFIFPRDYKGLFSDSTFLYKERELLTEAGIMLNDVYVIKYLNLMPIGKFSSFYSGKYKIRVTKRENTKSCDFPIFQLTRVGKELITLLTIEVDDDYIKDFCSYLRSMGLLVEYALFINNDGNPIKGDLLWQEFDGGKL